MPTPRHGYSVNGKKVPSVTQIIGRYKNPKGLMGWVHKCGMERLCFKKEGRNAANIGTAVHDAIERTIRGEAQVANPTQHYELPFGGMTKARRCFEGWKRWNSMVCPDYKELEPQLVHGELLYGGTIDAIAIVNGELCIVDWKTSNGIYDETVMQVAAYARLWEHNTDQRIDKAYVLRMDKKTGKFEQFLYDDLEPYFNHFMRQLEMFNDEKAIFPAPCTKTTEFRLTKLFSKAQPPRQEDD